MKAIEMYPAREIQDLLEIATRVKNEADSMILAEAYDDCVGDERKMAFLGLLDALLGAGRAIVASMEEKRDGGPENKPAYVTQDAQRNIARALEPHGGAGSLGTSGPSAGWRRGFVFDELFKAALFRRREAIGASGSAKFDVIYKAALHEALAEGRRKGL